MYQCALKYARPGKEVEVMGEVGLVRSGQKTGQVSPTHYMGRAPCTSAPGVY